MVINVLVEEYYFPLSTWEPVSTVDKKIARFKPPPPPPYLAPTLLVIPLPYHQYPPPVKP